MRFFRSVDAFSSAISSFCKGDDGRQQQARVAMGAGRLAGKHGYDIPLYRPAENSLALLQSAVAFAGPCRAVVARRARLAPVSDQA